MRRDTTVAERNREPQAANEIVLARDRLIRQQPATTYDAITNLVLERAKAKSYKIAAPAKRIIVTPGSGYVCSATVSGIDYPHLIPEAIYWQSFFGLYSNASEPYHYGYERFDERLIQGLQKGSLPLPARYLVRFLQTAREVTASVRQAQQNGDSRLSIANTVMEARAALMRAVPEDVWLTVNTRASGIRAGIKFTFPPGWLVLDRNGNESIDDGGELFGNATCPRDGRCGWIPSSRCGISEGRHDGLLTLFLGVELVVTCRASEAPGPPTPTSNPCQSV